MLLKILINLFIIGFFIGCSTLSVKEQVIIPEESIEAFKDLLNSGWEMKVVDNKVVLIKFKEDEILIYDLFKE